VNGAVQVTNLPAVQEVVGAVEVTNLPAASAPARFQLVGFTSATYTGAMGGPFGVTQKCQIEFPNSRMCSVEEVILTTTIPSGLTGTAWVHLPADDRQAVQASVEPWPYFFNCNGYSEESDSSIGVVVDINGLANQPHCIDVHRIACCALVP
jgi:hypothetical protein